MTSAFRPRRWSKRSNAAGCSAWPVTCCPGRGGPTFTFGTAAEQLGVTAEEVARAWALLGLTAAGPDAPVLSQADVDALQTWLAIKAVVGEGGAHGLLRVLGVTMARLA